MEESEYEQVSWSEFLATRAPGMSYRIPDAVKQISQAVSRVFQPELLLYCGNETCGGNRFFECVSPVVSPGEGSKEFFLDYQCRNCKGSGKSYAIRAVMAPLRQDSLALKVGEYPPFGPPTPARVISLIGPDKEIFLKGRRAENQGLGIGAFSYYRRVVENQKSRIITEIGKVAKRLGANKLILDKFELAEQETQFSKAIGDIKDSIPHSLLIDGHNPLTLLHNALSEGLHAQTDEECLQIATSIRVVMTDLAERISAALKDEAELKQAVSRLLNRVK